MPTQASWRVTDDGDLDLTSSAPKIVRGRDAVIGRLRIALGTRRGEWRGDLLAGPDEDLTTGRFAFLGEAENEYARIAQAVEGVQTAQVTRTGYAPDTRTGLFLVRVTLDPDNGGGSEELTLDLA